MSHQPGKGPNATPKIHAQVELTSGGTIFALLEGANADEALEKLLARGESNYVYIEERHSLPDFGSPIIDELGVEHPGVKTTSTFHHVKVMDIVAVTQ